MKENIYKLQYTRSDKMITAKDLFEQIKELNTFGNDMKFYIMYRDANGNTTTVSNEDVEKSKPKVSKPKYDKTFYEALSALHSDKNSLYIEVEGSKKRVALAPNGQYTVSPALEVNLFNTYYGGGATHCINEKELGAKWLVKYKPSEPACDLNNGDEPPSGRSRDEKGRFIKKDY